MKKLIAVSLSLLLLSHSVFPQQYKPQFLSKTQKSPVIAFALSFGIPIIVPICGAGQFYNEDTLGGIWWCTLGLISCGMVLYGIQKTENIDTHGSQTTVTKEPRNRTLAVSGAASYLFTWLYSSYDAYKYANNKRHIPRRIIGRSTPVEDSITVGPLKPGPIFADTGIQRLKGHQEMYQQPQ